MTRQRGDLERIFAALEASGARYLVVGGVAVVLHGHPRFTADLDLVVALDAENVQRVLEALGELDYRPRAPVAAKELADPARREDWIRNKRMTVFSLWSPVLAGTEVDLFVEPPLPFEEAYARSLELELRGVRVRVVSLEDLVAMKRRAGRPGDLEDVRRLEAIARDLREGE